jgi:hypothetical protein
VGDDSHVVSLVKNFLVKKEVWDGSLSWCYSQFCLLSPKFGAKSSHVFAQSQQFFVNISLDVEENDENDLDFSLHQSRIFRSRWVCIFPFGGLLLSCIRNRMYLFSYSIWMKSRTDCVRVRPPMLICALIQWLLLSYDESRTFIIDLLTFFMTSSSQKLVMYKNVPPV